MPRKYLINWFREKNDFLREPLPSASWDDLIAIPRVQKQIAKSTKTRRLYGYVEAKIGFNYARLINFKLREAVSLLDRSDFDDPSGFSVLEKASIKVLNYLKVKNVFEHFVKQDIYQHSSRDAQLNAFRRWIGIAELLLKWRCYDGFLLVMPILMLEDKLVQELPGPSGLVFENLAKLASSEGNFSVLRGLIDTNKTAYDLPPVLLRSKDLSIANFLLDQYKNENEPGSYLRCASFEVKEKILRAIGEEKKESQRDSSLPDYLAQSYELLVDEYEANKLLSPAISFRTLYSQKGALVEPSRLYTTEGMLPSFWKRRCTERTYWKNLFESSEGPRQ